MPDNPSFGFDPDDFDRVFPGAGEQLRAALNQFGRLLEGSGDRAGWSRLFDEFGHRARSNPQPETTGEAGDGVWAIYTLNETGAAQIEQVYATELDALRANQHDTTDSRRVRFLPYGIAVSALDQPDLPPDDEPEDPDH